MPPKHVAVTPDSASRTRKRNLELNGSQSTPPRSSKRVKSIPLPDYADPSDDPAEQEPKSDKASRNGTSVKIKRTVIKARNDAEIKTEANGQGRTPSTPGKVKKSVNGTLSKEEEARSVKSIKQEEEAVQLSTPTKQRKQRIEKHTSEVNGGGSKEEAAPTPQQQHGKAKVKAKPKLKSVTESEDYTEIKEGAEDTAVIKIKRRRKTKEEKDAEAMPLAARSLNSRLFVGAHVSAAGGVHNCINNALHIGGNSFALFLKSQRKWENPALKDEHLDSFRSLCVTHKYAPNEHIVPHGSYLVNLAQADETKAAQAYASFLDDLQRCEKLGIRLYNFHPGNTGCEPRPQALARIAARLNTAHKATSTVVTLLENMAASPSGNTIGGCFEDLRDVIALVEDKSRVGVCFDTCHAFAAGFDLRSPEAFRDTFEKFDRIIGGQYLRAVHLNDSKAPLSSHRDLHYNIGLGFLGLRAFHNLVNDPRFHSIPLVLETPLETKNAEGKVIEDQGVWAREIKLLESLVGMDVDSEEFRSLEKDLWEKGAKERARLQEVHDRKTAESAKKAAGGRKGKAKGKKAVEDDVDDSNQSD